MSSLAGISCDILLANKTLNTYPGGGGYNLPVRVAGMQVRLHHLWILKYFFTYYNLFNQTIKILQKICYFLKFCLSTTYVVAIFK